MQGNGKSVYTKRISGGKNRLYFIDVYQSEKTGNKYLMLSESRYTEGIWKKDRLLVFASHAKALKEGLDEAFGQLNLSESNESEIEALGTHS